MRSVEATGQSSTATAADDEPTSQPAEPAPAKPAPAPQPPAQQQVAKAVADYQAHPDASTQQQVYSAVSSELDAQMHPANVCLPNQTPADQQARIKASGNNILRNASKDPAAQNVLKGAIAQYQAHNLASLDGHGLTARQALDSLNTAVKGLPSKTAEDVLKSPAGQKIYQDAAKSVTQPLNGVNPQSAAPGATGRAQMGLTQAWSNLSSLTAGIPAWQAQQLVKASLPAIEKVATKMPPQNISPQMFNDATNVVSHISKVQPDNTEEASEARTLTSQIAKGYTGFFATSGPDSNPLGPSTLVSSLANGADPTLAVAITKSLTAAPRQNAEALMNDGMQTFQSKVKADISTYSGDYQQLNWLIGNVGKGMTPAQLNQAVKTYTQNPQWIKKSSADYQQMVKDGSALLQQLKAMHASGDPQLQSQVTKILSDKPTQYALDAAIKSNPGVTTQPGWESTLSFLSSQLKTVSTAKSLVQDFATEHVKRAILPSMSELRQRNPVSYNKAIEKLESDDTKSMLKAMGVPPKTAESLITGLQNAMPEETDSRVQRRARITALNKQITQLNSHKSSAQAASDPTSMAGRLVLGIGVAASAVSLYNDAKAVGQNPTPQDMAQLLSGAVSAQQQFGKAAQALGLSSPDAGVIDENMAKLISKAPDADSALNSAFAFGSAYHDLTKGDDADATFKSLNGVSGLLTTDTAATVLDSAGEALGVTIGDASLGSLAGPVGIGIGLAVALGQNIYSHYKEETQYENPATTKFLEGAGLNPSTAKALTQEGGGYSAMPVIAKYAEMNGYNLQHQDDQKQFAQWLNGLSSGQLQHLFEQATFIQSRTGGDTSKFIQGSAAPGADPHAPQPTAYWLQYAMGAFGIHLPKAPS